MANPLSPFEVLVDYEQRSLSHVAGMPEQIEAPGLWRGIGYRLGARNLASGFGEVVEIITLPPLTPVPGGDIWLLGVANIRSTLLPVVDLKLFLEGERTVLHETTRALVVKQAGGNDGRYGSFVKQAYKLGDTVWGVFSMALLTRTPEFRQAAAA
jgi:twitching motility protein PilI